MSECFFFFNLKSIKRFMFPILFRFSLARSVLRGSVCLILDEATSSLDSETEKSLMDAANKAFQGRTVISIAVIIIKILHFDQ